MKLLTNNKMASTGLAAVLATFFVLSSFGPADARHRYRHRGFVNGFVLGAGAGFVAGSRARGRTARRHWGRHCHRNRRGRIYRCHNHRHGPRHHR